MSVKPQIFQQTKQTILKNKRQFIQIQLKQANIRINNLRNQNVQLKNEIKTLKLRPNRQSGKNMDIDQKLLSERQKTQLIDKQNECVNKRIKNEVSTDRHANSKTNFSKKILISSKSSKKCSSVQIQNQIKQFQQQLIDREHQKQKQLEQLEKYICSLKALCLKKNQKTKILNMNLINSQTNTNHKQSLNLLDNQKQKKSQSIYDLQTFRNKEKLSKIAPDLIYTDNHTQRINEDRSTKRVILNSLGCSNLVNFQQQLSDFSNTNNTFNEEKHHKRKTMSLSLNNSINLTPGFPYAFNFGKKPINKAGKCSDSVYTNKMSVSNDRQCQIEKQARKSSASMMVFINPNENKNKSSQLAVNNLSMSHSNSKNSISFTTNASKSKLKRSDATKSYAKIVTKLICCGCKIQYRPNQYYSHIQKCREYEKIKLLEQKQKIQDQINQTLNLSIPII